MKTHLEHFVPTISVIATIRLFGLALGTLILNGQMRLENRLVAVEGRPRGRAASSKGSDSPVGRRRPANPDPRPPGAASPVEAIRSREEKRGILPAGRPATARLRT